MAIGLSPKYATTYPLATLSREQALVLLIEAASRLGWSIHYVSSTGIIAAVPTLPAQITIRISETEMRIESASLVRELTDGGRNKRNALAFMSMLNELRTGISDDYYAFRYEQLKHYLPPPEADALLHSPHKERSHAADILTIFRPTKDYFITPIVLNLNILLFLLMGLSGVNVLEPDSRSLIDWGANFGPLTANGQWWRLITCCFLHIGVLHLLMNMYAFLLIGAQLEPRLGERRFLGAYLLTGIIASLTSLWWHSETISAGASGAIFGMYGVFLGLLLTDLVEKSKRKQLLASIIFFVGYNLLGGLKEGIDNAAHIGGLVAGLLTSFLFIPALRKAQLAQKPAASEPVSERAPDADYYYD